jgi:hypothetical protein
VRRGGGEQAEEHRHGDKADSHRSPQTLSRARFSDEAEGTAGARTRDFTPLAGTTVALGGAVAALLGEPGSAELATVEAVAETGEGSDGAAETASGALVAEIAPEAADASTSARF